MQRIVDATDDVEALKRLCKQLLQAAACQVSATRWALEQLMDAQRAEVRALRSKGEGEGQAGSGGVLAPVQGEAKAEHIA